MQLCDRRTLLALARCSRQCLAAASCDFAFRSLSPLVVHARPQLAALVSSSLLRFCDISLLFPKMVVAMSCNAQLCMLDCMRCVPRLREVACSFRIEDDSWNAVTHPNMRAVTTLPVDAEGFGRVHIQHIAEHLPVLRCMRLLGLRLRISADAVGALSVLTSLRELCLPCCPVVDFVCLSSALLAPRLERLTMAGVDSDEEVDLSRQFAAFSGLRYLSVVNCHSPFLLQAALTNIPTLETARCQLFLVSDSQYPSPVIIAHAATLLAVMRARKQLAATRHVAAPCCLQLEIVSDHFFKHNGQPTKEGSLLWAQALESFKPVLDESDAVIRFELSTTVNGVGCNRRGRCDSQHSSTPND